VLIADSQGMNAEIKSIDPGRQKWKGLKTSATVLVVNAGQGGTNIYHELDRSHTEDKTKRQCRGQSRVDRRDLDLNTE